jgi:ectoine hydroxylase-related dioxygenase (phytanoyl-CoA dioxygenase family)
MMKHEPEVWKKAYQDDGFVIVRDVLDPATLAALREGMDRVTGNLDGLRPRLREKIFLERDHVKNNPQWYAGILSPEQCGTSVRQIADLAEFDPVFAELICYPPLLDVLEVLFGSPEFSLNLLIGRPKVAHVGNGISNGAFHRDTPFEDFTSANSIIALLCLDEMTGANGSTTFIRASHRIADDEAKELCWREVLPEALPDADKVVTRCPAGAGIFFSSKMLHAAGHNRSDHPRRTIQSEWGGPGVLPTSLARHSCQGLRPRSHDPVYQKQVRMTFPRLFAGHA